MTVTTQDRVFAERLYDAVHPNSQASPSFRKVSTEAIARLLVDYREVILSCALVRVERTYNVRERKK